MAKSKHSGKAWKNGYKVYAAAKKYSKNRVAKLTRHILKNPNDVVATQALARGEKNGFPWRRKNPRNRGTIAVFDKKLNKTTHIHAKAFKSFEPSGYKLPEHLKNLIKIHPSRRGGFMFSLLKDNQGVYFKIS